VTEAPLGPPKSSTGLDQNVAGALAYVLWPISSIALLLIEKESKFVKFHSMQAILVVVALIGLDILVGASVILWPFFPLIFLAQGVLWLFLMFKAFSGEAYRLPYIGDIAEKQSQK
jgi:uncharacterized membrane protein